MRTDLTTRFDLTMPGIKARFPAPTPNEHTAPAHPGRSCAACYCVGGAFLLSLSGTDLLTAAVTMRFPTADDIVRGLEMANPQLTYWTALEIAQNIVTLNDRGDFEQAWHWLGIGLPW